jgi:very-short-patch-repair endonuclease
MRRLFTSDEVTEAVLRWGERKGRWRRVDRKVWADGPEEPSTLDRARAAVLATGGVASHHLAGVLHGLDSVTLDGLWVTLPPIGNGRRPHACRRALPSDCVVRVCGLPCTHGQRTLADLVASLSDAVWEQALESALRKRLVSIEAVTGNRQVLGRRPAGAPPTESLLETLMVQLIRTVAGLPEPVRQLWIDAAGARLDLAWPELGLFIELDGQHHKGQPVYDARRETAVVAATGWLCGRFTWTEVVHTPNSTARRLAALAAQARRRPVPQPRSSSATR